MSTNAEHAFSTRLRGRAAVVTGAGSGIGRAIALRLAAEGATVMVGDLDADSARATVDAVQAADGVADAAVVDVRDPASVAALVDRTVDAWGRLDVAVANAGIGIAGDALGQTVEEWDRMFEVNARGTFLTCRQALRVMVRQGAGSIVATASIGGMVGLAGRAGYCASKAAVVGFVKAAAVDCAETGVRINAISPGTVDSPWIGRITADADDPVAQRRLMEARQPIGRLGRPEEIAGMVAYLASDESTFMTGSNVVVDGGVTAR